MGFDVSNSPVMSGIKRSLAASAASQSPAAASSTISFMRAGDTLPMVEMTPAPPRFMTSSVAESSPEYTTKPSGAPATMAST